MRRFVTARVQLAPAAIGSGQDRQHRPEIRGDATRWIDPAAPSATERRWLARIETLRRAINRYTFAGLVDWEGHWALYPPGAGYARHVDVPRGREARRVSTVLYLNDDWQPGHGGALRMFDDTGFTDVDPRGGTLVVFWSDQLSHAVLPIAVARWSLIGWFRVRA